MSGMGRHASPPVTWDPTRLGVTTAVAALVAVAAIIGAVAANSVGQRPAAGTAAARVNPAPALPGREHVPAGAPRMIAAARRATMPLVLTASDHRDCPAAAAACVDLARHITWLQAKGKITFGPIRMEPGKPGSRHQTPRGTFHVAWKAGPSYMSNIYFEPMPWATFFASGGIAFHGGSLTAWSHGCVHMADTNAHYYNAHLPIGAEVVVF